MAQYSDEELKYYLSLLTWDTNITPDEYLAILKGDVPEVKGFTKRDLYYKIVNGFNWHKVRHIIPEEELKEALSDDIINNLFPRSRRTKYRYVRSLL